MKRNSTAKILAVLIAILTLGACGGKTEEPAATTPSGTSSSTSTSSSSSGTAYYRVKQNDTLSGIARRYNTSVDKLCKLNHISKTSILSIGQKIRYR